MSYMIFNLVSRSDWYIVVMRAKYMLWLVLVACSWPSYGQSGSGYLPMLEDGRVWSLLATTYSGCPEFNALDSSFDYGMVDSMYYMSQKTTKVGEVVIDGKTYNNYINVLTGLNIGFLREVRDSGRVYQRIGGDVLAIDLSMGLGDTINTAVFKSFLGLDPTGSSIIVSVEDSVLIDGEYRRRLGFDIPDMPRYVPSFVTVGDCSGAFYTKDVAPSETFYWIEGIGSTFGFFGYHNGKNPVERLVCLSDSNDNLVYSKLDSTYNCDSVFIDFPDFPSGLEHGNAYTAPEASVVVFPNPTQSALTIASEGLSCTPCLIEAYDVQGHRVVLEQTTNPAQAELDVSVLAPGLYILQVLDGAHAVQSRFHVQR